MDRKVVEIKELSKHYQQGQEQLAVLKELTLTVSAGQPLAIMGQSGSGKSTLLHCIGGLDNFDSGEILIKNESLKEMNSAELAAMRNAHLGFIYQFHHLLPEFSALENVAMPLLIKGANKQEACHEAQQWLRRVGLEQRFNHKPGALSGGERQRVAIARALVNKPACVLADEPTGNLDRANAEHIAALIQELAEQSGVSFIIATHDHGLATSMGRVMHLIDGQLQIEE